MTSSGAVTNIFDFNGTDSNGTLTNLTDIGDDGGISSTYTKEGRDVMEFVGFLSWYVMLVICCVVPPCVAYRRRRMYERASEDHHRHPYLQQLADYGLIMLPHQEENQQVQEHDRRQTRSRDIEEMLKQTTMVVKEKDLIYEEVEYSSDDIEMFKDDVQSDDDDGDDDDDGTMIQLGRDMLNGNRQIPAVCAICLCSYEVDDAICISPNEKCVHAFHTECAITWLSKTDETKCPCCRQDFCAKGESPLHESERKASVVTQNESSSSSREDEEDDWSDDESHRI